MGQMENLLAIEYREPRRRRESAIGDKTIKDMCSVKRGWGHTGTSVRW